MKLKYLKNVNSRRRGIAIELAIFTLMLCFGLSIIILTTSMIQKNNYNRVYSEYTEKLELERIGAEFCSAIKNNDLAYFEFKFEEEVSYNYEISDESNITTLTITDVETSEEVFIVELTKVNDGANYEITRWEFVK